MTPLATPIDLVQPARLLFGRGVAAEAGRWLAGRGVRRPMVVTDAFNAARVGCLELPGEPYRMLLRTTRVQLLDEFTRRLSAWLQLDYVADDWYPMDPNQFETSTEFAEALKQVDLRQRLDMAALLQRMQARWV